MANAQKALVDAATHAAANSGGGWFSIVGVSGVALEWKHGLLALTKPFAGCSTLIDFVQRLGTLDDTTFLGLGMWLAILAGSLVALTLGMHRMIRRLFRYLGRMLARARRIRASVHNR